MRTIIFIACLLIVASLAHGQADFSRQDEYQRDYDRRQQESRIQELERQAEAERRRRQADQYRNPDPFAPRGQERRAPGCGWTKIC